MNPRRGDGRKCFKATPGGAPEIGLSVPEILRSDERVEPHAGLREEHPASLLAIDDADAFFHDRAVASQALDRASKRPTGRDNVLDEEDALAIRQVPFEILLRPMLLRRLAHHDVRLAARQADRGGGRGGAAGPPPPSIPTPGAG